MYELIKLNENDYYIDCPSKIGIVRLDSNGVMLIDSGSDKDTAKKVYRVLEENAWQLRFIINTHSHADHIGGNAFLQEKTNCEIYANNLECAFTQNPILEPMGLYGGLPFKELKGKFLVAKESRVLPLCNLKLPDGMSVLNLKGHCFDMVGLLTKGGTAYIGDSVSSKETLSKYGIGYLYNVNETLDTLEFLKGVQAKRFVPSHAPVSDDITSLADYNIEAVNKVKENILSLCATPVTFEELLKKVFDTYNTTVNAVQYALIGSTVRSYLSCLLEENKVSYVFCENRMLWQAI